MFFLKVERTINNTVCIHTWLVITDSVGCVPLKRETTSYPFVFLPDMIKLLSKTYNSNTLHGKVRGYVSCTHVPSVIFTPNKFIFVMFHPSKPLPSFVPGHCNHVVASLWEATPEACVWAPSREPECWRPQCGNHRGRLVLHSSGSCIYPFPHAWANDSADVEQRITLSHSL